MLCGGFEPEIGDQFDIVTATGVTESFSAMVLPDVEGARVLLVDGVTTASVVVTWPADADGDLDVDLDDYLAFLACMTGPAGGVDPGCTYYDADDDTDVDLLDFTSFAQDFTGGR